VHEGLDGSKGQTNLTFHIL